MKLTMFPGAGERQVCFVGDRLELALSLEGGLDFPAGGQAFLRTTIGAGTIQDDEVIRAFESSTVPSHAAWYDIPLQRNGGRFEISLELPEPGFYRAKPYYVDAAGHQHWPLGDDFGVSVHPNRYRTANSIYCAWPRLFGETKELSQAIDPEREASLQSLDDSGYSVIPPSGTLRELGQELDHIIGRLGCRILHLLPVNPTPTTVARFGRFGSPYASIDLTAVDPALVEFDQRMTGVEQFCEFVRSVHHRGAVVFIDLVINHTGWGSRLYETYPEWFRRHEDGRFASPGAWGTVWEDLVELEHHDPKLGEELAEVFLTWCRRGVDGFRCDAGYMVPLPIWRYITARVRREYPNTIFLLEGLGGAWEVTEQLLTEGGMQWAYSELFQNYSGEQIAWYTDYALPQSQRMGLYVHYSETHDNPRLAAKGALWSQLRNYLCGLTSVSGAFGFTCGVEWLAAEKIIVHQRTGLNWGKQPNLVEELARLTRLLASHPCFFDGARLRRISESTSPVFALERESAAGEDRVLVLINSDVDIAQQITLEKNAYTGLSGLTVDLLEQAFPKRKRLSNGAFQFELPPGAAYCLARSEHPNGADGETYRSEMEIRSWVIETVHSICPEALFSGTDWTELIPQVRRDPVHFLAVLRHAVGRGRITDLPSLLAVEPAGMPFPQIVVWEKGDHQRIVPVPENHWFLIRSEAPCEVTVSCEGMPTSLERRSTRLDDERHVVCFDVRPEWEGRAVIQVATLGDSEEFLRGELEFLKGDRVPSEKLMIRRAEGGEDLEAPVVLLTNGRGGMARLAVDFGEIKSKYDCLLGANLHPTVPVDRYVLAKRARLWANAGGLITGLRQENLLSFEPGPPAVWRYLICGGRGRWIPLEVSIDLMADKNTVVIRCRRLRADSMDPDDVAILYGENNAARAKAIPSEEIDAVPVSLTLRIDIEDRGFHSETQLNPGTEHHFETHTTALNENAGFRFQPAHDRLLEVVTSDGAYFEGVEWSSGLSHPVEASRGQTGNGDAYSPGWFEVEVNNDRPVLFVVTAEKEKVDWQELGRVLLDARR